MLKRNFYFKIYLSKYFKTMKKTYMTLIYEYNLPVFGKNYINCNLRVSKQLTNFCWNIKLNQFPSENFKFILLQNKIINEYICDISGFSSKFKCRDRLLKPTGFVAYALIIEL